MEGKGKLTCIIIEDEPIAAEVLADYVHQIPFLKLEGVFSDALFALEFLKTNPIELIFLDLHLPRLKGFDFLSTLKTKPYVIITTAYHEHALRGYEFGVIDYLMKPIEFSRFLQAVNKLPSTDKDVSSPDHYFFNVNKKMVKVYLEDVWYIESLKDYSKIYFNSEFIVTRMQIGMIESIFTAPKFRRIHRSFLIHVPKVKSYSSTEVEINGQLLPIGKTFKNELENWFNLSIN